jgi:Na+/proline symporter
VSGPFWYASGATIQVLLFAILAIEIKRKCPAIHTMLEIVLVRWGTTAHLTFLFFALMTNIIVTAMLILGGFSFLSLCLDCVACMSREKLVLPRHPLLSSFHSILFFAIKLTDQAY